MLRQLGLLHLALGHQSGSCVGFKPSLKFDTAIAATSNGQNPRITVTKPNNHQKYQTWCVVRLKESLQSKLGLLSHCTCSNSMNAI